MKERWNFNNRERIIIIRVRAAVKVKLRNHKVIQTSTLLLVHSILFLGSLRLLFYSFSYHSLTASRELESETIETSVNLSTTTMSEEACKRWASMLQIDHRQQWGLLGITLFFFCTRANTTTRRSVKWVHTKKAIACPVCFYFFSPLFTH